MQDTNLVLHPGNTSDATDGTHTVQLSAFAAWLGVALLAIEVQVSS